MSTDFCVETILQGSCNSSISSQKSPTTLTPPHSPTVTPPQASKRGQKRKREEDENTEPKPVKRGRTSYSKAQLSYLESVFSHTPYPDKLLKESIADKLGLQQQKVHVWFQNRRSKQRKATGHPAPPVVSAHSQPKTPYYYPPVTSKHSFVPDPTMPIYYPLRTPSPSLVPPQRTPPSPYTNSPPLYLPFTASSLPPPLISPPHRPAVPYPVPRTTLHNVTVSNVMSLPSQSNFGQHRVGYW